MPQATLLDLQLTGILRATGEGELRRIEELAAARLLFHRINRGGLLPEPQDDSWLTGLPVGPIQEATRQLRTWNNPEVVDRPEGVTPSVAAEALRTLYTMLHKMNQ